MPARDEDIVSKYRFALSDLALHAIRCLTDTEGFALALLVTSSAALIAVLLNRLMERTRIPTPLLILVGAAVAVSGGDSLTHGLQLRLRRPGPPRPPVRGLVPHQGVPQRGALGATQRCRRGRARRRLPHVPGHSSPGLGG